MIFVVVAVAFWSGVNLSLRRTQRARQTRGLIFAVLASIAGPWLLVGAWPRQLLFAYDIRHFICFGLAAGHWIVAFFEDLSADAAGAENSVVFSNVKDLKNVVRLGYVVHHGATALVYLDLILTRRLAGLGAIGLCYELPVVFQYTRELGLHSHLRFFWTAWFCAYVLSRLGSTLLYLVSLFVWPSPLHRVLHNTHRAVLFHGSACFFTYINATYFTLLVAWHDADRRLLDRSRPEEAHQVDDL